MKIDSKTVRTVLLTVLSLMAAAALWSCNPIDDPTNRDKGNLNGTEKQRVENSTPIGRSAVSSANSQDLI